MTVYATAGDYTAVTGQTAPADIDARLAAASDDIAYATRTAVYDTDTDGLPTDTVVLDAFMRATCWQAAYSIDSGVTATGTVVSVDGSIGSLTVRRSVRAAGAAASDAAPAIAPRATKIIALCPGLSLGTVGDPHAQTW